MLQNDSLVGQKMGDYQVLEELGRGGMAVVYKAQHLQLGRYEALKVLHPHLLRDQEIVQRFSQEARAAANLYHSNIATIYNVIQQNGHFIISMEYVEGRSLEQIIAEEGVLSLERTIHILRQVSQALDYAHSRHLIHRDIKPANILVRMDDYAVVTDFGIAKAVSGSGMTTNLTQSGIIGTPAYMSPEHIRGEEVDYRTDLYSLGIVCYEMLSGVSPFDNTTTASIVYAQLNTFPSSIRQLNTNLPEYVGAAIRRMLAKRPENRFQSATAFVEALAGKSSFQPMASPKNKTEILPPDQGASSPSYPPPNQPAAPPPPYAPPSQPSWNPQAVPPSQQEAKKPKTIWFILGGGFALLFLFAVVAAGVLFLPRILGSENGAASDGGSSSDNANLIAFTSERDGNAEIYTMRPDGSEQINLTKSPSEDFRPMWSPDGTKIAFHSYEAGDVGGNAEIYSMNADGSNWVRLTRHEAADKFPCWSPDGEKLAFVSDRDGDYEVYTMAKDGAQVTQLTDNPARDYFPAWSPDGKRIVFESNRDGKFELFMMDADGSNVVKLTDDPSRDRYAAWSPDGSKIAFTSERSGQPEIWIIDVNSRSLTQVTRDGGRSPYWSPDGNRLAFVLNDNIYVIDQDGNNKVQLTYAVKDRNPNWMR